MISYAFGGFVKRLLRRRKRLRRGPGRGARPWQAALPSDRRPYRCDAGRRAPRRAGADRQLSAGRAEDGGRVLAAAGVSSPTILRFVARIGFQNYPEFQSALQDELAAQLQSPASRTRDRASTRAARCRRWWKRRSKTSAKLPARLGEPDRRHRRAAVQPARRRCCWSADASPTRLPATWRRTWPSYGRTSSSGRSGGQLARPADRHGQARRARGLRHQALPGQPAALRREGAPARRADRAVHRPVAVADRPFRPPRHRRAHRGAVARGIPPPRCSSLPKR